MRSTRTDATLDDVEADSPHLDHAEAASLLHCLAPDEQWTFQTFDDSPRKRRELNRVLHGTLPEHLPTLKELQSRGAGAFVMVNKGDGLGRKGHNVTGVRAVFVDLDGVPVEPVQQATLAPHVMVETSPGKFHAYWRVSDCPLERFSLVQAGLIAKFNADTKVKDINRVMRLPGFLHLKEAPYRTRIISLNNRAPYRLAELELAFPEIRQQRAARAGKSALLIPRRPQRDRLLNG